MSNYTARHKKKPVERRHRAVVHNCASKLMRCPKLTKRKIINQVGMSTDNKQVKA